MSNNAAIKFGSDRYICSIDCRLRSLSNMDLATIISLEQRNFLSPWSREMFEAEFALPFSISAGIEGDGRLKGYIFARALFDELHILTLCVDHPFRRSGYASVMLEHIIGIAVRRGLKSAWLEARKGNLPARLLYQSMGFREQYIRKNYYSNNGEDAVVFSLEFNGTSGLLCHQS